MPALVREDDASQDLLSTAGKRLDQRPVTRRVRVGMPVGSNPETQDQRSMGVRIRCALSAYALRELGPVLDHHPLNVRVASDMVLRPVRNQFKYARRDRDCGGDQDAGEHPPACVPTRGGLVDLFVCVHHVSRNVEGAEITSSWLRGSIRA
jgi:hypothetical protein